MKRIIKRLFGIVSPKASLETSVLLSGRQFALVCRFISIIYDLNGVGFKVFSQNGGGGIIDWLASKLLIIHQAFIELGVEHYDEANTRFLLMNRN